MDELSPRARALLDAAQGSDDPLPADAARIRQSVLVRIGSAGVAAALFTFSVERAKAFLGAALPKFVAVALLAAGSSALYQHWKASEAPREASVSVPAVAPSAPVVTTASAAPLAPDPEPVATATSVPVLPAAKPAVVAREPRHDNLEAEMRWVRAADAALRGGDVGLALSLLNQHAREFPNGALTEEREGLRVVAACQGGASPVVQRAASRFLQRSPRSLMAGRVRAACPTLPETGS
ncbi:MAG TPA: hypothetical protein VNW92_03280 [Polyangiaceae bacterium]|jgi:hypothetical protein|nr:hypothetical protein [Polyangiaceae bacterium]